MPRRIGFIGLGSMGRPFATNIVQAGFDLFVHDVRPDPVAELVKLGAHAASSAREVAQRAEIVHVAVHDEDQVDDVLHGDEGLMAGAHPGLIAVIHTSVHPVRMQRAAEELRARGIATLDAQMSGGVGGVVNRKMCLMVGGDPAVLEQCRPVLETTASSIYLMGDVGMGAVTKIAQNMMTATYLMASMEGFRIAEKAGVDLEVFQEVVRTSSAQSYVADKYLKEWGDREARWMYHQVLWDALDLAHTYDVELPGAATCLQALAHGLLKAAP
ncbi:MAG TPA: NAD(P)-dependent oxidoreductase [Chloroflexota bacterium]|nr:NAD(P)-dependent oxidoreductase [Chloroflexota bacterium]